MIIQGTNFPIIFTFEDSMTSIKDIEISLYNSDAELKHWTLTDVTIENDTVIAPLTQIESVEFPEGNCIIEIKWLDENGKTNFVKNIRDKIIKKNDKTIMEGAD